MRAIAANEGRCPISVQCRLLGVARSTFCSMRSRPDRPAAPDPAAPAVVAAHAASKGCYGSRKIKASLERSGVTVSRHQVCRIMRKDARLVRSAFATLPFPISDIEVFRTDRGSEFDNAEIDLVLKAFGIERLLSAKGCPHDNAVDESTNGILKAELIHREAFGTTRELRAKFSDYVHWYNNFRINSTLGYISPVEFRKAGLSLPESSK